METERARGSLESRHVRRGTDQYNNNITPAPDITTHSPVTQGLQALERPDSNQREVETMKLTLTL